MNMRMEEKEKDDEKKEKPTSPRIDEKLFKSRTILLYGEISQDSARDVCARLLALAADNDDDIRLFINSPGGHVESGDSIFDMIRFVKPKVKIIGTGWVASAGALIYSTPPIEQRLCLPNTRFMLHQPSGGVGGQATDIGIEAQEILKMRKRLNETFAKQTGQPIEKIDKDTERNYWMSAEEAKTYGLVGRIIQNATEI